MAGPNTLAAPTEPHVGLTTDGIGPEDVAQAERDVKLALAYLGRLGRTASSSVAHLTERPGHGR